jgi:periplasmic divalent cation tolerance protein
MDELVVLYTTWPDAETAEAFGRRAVEERLAACANVLAPMRSIYRWEGQVQSEAEVPMLLKTTAAAAAALGRLIVEHHPYDTPCVLSLDVDTARCNLKYVSWLKAAVE